MTAHTHRVSNEVLQGCCFGPVIELPCATPDTCSDAKLSKAVELLRTSPARGNWNLRRDTFLASLSSDSLSSAEQRTVRDAVTQSSNLASAPRTQTSRDASDRVRSGSKAEDTSPSARERA